VEWHALKNSAGGRKRFAKHCVLVGDPFRNQGKVFERQLEKLSVSTVAANDSQDRARSTMPWIAGSTKITLTAADVYFTHHALANEKVIGRRFDDTDELVADGPFESCVTACDFQVRITNARQHHANKSFIAAFRFFHFAERDSTLCYSQGLHCVTGVSFHWRKIKQAERLFTKCRSQ
jgi:hypothetical protein